MFLIMTIWADQFQVFYPIVITVSILVVDLQDLIFIVTTTFTDTPPFFQ